MNILVTGANGQLGQSLKRVADQDSKHHYIYTDVCEGYRHLDITNLESIRQMVRDEQVSCIINCAAWTNVDKAETAGTIVETLNADAPAYLAQAMQEVDGFLVHISTDYVFGAEPYNTPCREDQKGTPTGVYGLTKLHGEQRIVKSGAHHVIIRTSWLYSEFGNNFVKTMLRLTAEKEQLRVVFDQCGTPTYAGDLAQAIHRIVEDELWVGREGIYHYSNEGVTSWFDFARKIAQLAGQTSCDVQPCHSHEFPSPVKRPAYSVLDKTKIKEKFQLSIPYWEDSLKLCMERLGVLPTA